MCDRNGGNIQHLNDARDTDDAFVSHPSDFVIEYQTVDEVSERDISIVTKCEHGSGTDQQFQSSKNNTTISVEPSETGTATDHGMVLSNWKSNATYGRTVENAVINQKHWAMDNVNIACNRYRLQPCKIEADEVNESELTVNISDEVPVSKNENGGVVADEGISKSDIEMVNNSEAVKTNGFLSEYIAFQGEQGEQTKVVKCTKYDRLQKQTKRATKKLSKSVKVQMCTTKRKRGTKRLRKSLKNVHKKASRMNNASFLDGSLLKSETSDTTETNEESTVEEMDKSNSHEDSISNYIGTQTISGCNSSNNLPCPITYRYIINHITKDDDSILEWCHQVGLIPAEVQCECGSWKEIQMAKDKPLGLIRKCPSCKIRTSVLKGTWFESSHLSIAQIIELTYMWIYRLPQTYVQHELATSSHHTTGDWYLYCREVCAVILQKTSEKLGGFGKIVEVGETKVGKKKYNMGRLLEGQWILGGIERDSKKMFVVSVKERDVTTFLSIIKEWINPGTTVIAEYVKSYPFQNTEILKEFSATYNIHFIHSSNSPHGQSMNNRWKQRDAGDHRKEFPNTYFLEYMYRVKYSNTDDLFLTFVNHLSLVYPGK